MDVPPFGCCISTYTWDSIGQLQYVETPHSHYYGIKGRGHVDLVTLVLSELVGECRGEKLLKVQV